MKAPPLCYWHLKGVPEYGRGVRFFDPGCVKCAEKRAAGLVCETDPPPRELYRHWDRNMRQLRQARSKGAKR